MHIGMITIQLDADFLELMDFVKENTNNFLVPALKLASEFNVDSGNFICRDSSASSGYMSTMGTCTSSFLYQSAASSLTSNSVSAVLNRFSSVKYFDRSVRKQVSGLSVQPKRTRQSHKQADANTIGQMRNHPRQ